MTTTTLAPPAAAAPRPALRALPTAVRPQTLGRAMRSEWVKLRTLRSTWIGLASVVVVLVGLAAAAAAFSTDPGGDGEGGMGVETPVGIVLTGATFAVLLVGTLGSLAGAREYGSRMISATVGAVPRRWQVVVAKATVFGGATFAASLVGVLGAFALGMSLLSANGAPTSALTDDGVLRQVLGMAAYLTAIGLIGLGLGVLMRSVAGSVGAVVAGVIILPALAGALLPESWDALLQYLPSSAAASFTTAMGASDQVLSAGAGALVLTAWVAATLGGAALAITRRDV